MRHRMLKMFSSHIYCPIPHQKISPINKSSDLIIFILLLLLFIPANSFSSNDPSKTLTQNVADLAEFDINKKNRKTERLEKNILKLLPEVKDNHQYKEWGIDILIRRGRIPNFDNKLQEISKQYHSTVRDNSTPEQHKWLKLQTLEIDLKIIKAYRQSLSYIPYKDRSEESISQSEIDEISNKWNKDTKKQLLESAEDAIRGTKTGASLEIPILSSVFKAKDEFSKVVDTFTTTEADLDNYIKKMEEDSTNRQNKIDILDTGELLKKIERSKNETERIIDKRSIEKVNKATSNIVVFEEGLKAHRATLKSLEKKYEGAVKANNIDEAKNTKILINAIKGWINKSQKQYEVFRFSIERDLDEIERNKNLLGESLHISDQRLEVLRDRVEDVDLLKAKLEREKLKSEIHLAKIDKKKEREEKLKVYLKKCETKINNLSNLIKEKIIRRLLDAEKSERDNITSITGQVTADQKIHKDNLIGGVDLNYAKTFKSSNEIKNIILDEYLDKIDFVGVSGKKISIGTPINKEILSTLFFLKQHYGDVSNLSFTLNIKQSDMKKAQRRVKDFISKNKGLLQTKKKGIHLINTVSVPNYPYWFGANYGDTIIGKIALDADLALKYLIIDINPKTKQRFRLIPELTKAVNEKSKSYHVRLWLYLKSANIEIKNNKVNIGVEIGINTKSIKQISENDTVDVGESPDYIKNIATILENNFDKIAKVIPSWKALKEVYKGIAVVQLMDALGIRITTSKKANEIRKYIPKSTVNGRAYYHIYDGQIDRGIGGVDYALRNEYNNTPTKINNYYSQLYKIVNRESSDPYWKAIANFNEWDLEGAIEACNDGLKMSDQRWRLLNIRANALVCVALGLNKPKKFFDPVFLYSLLPDNYQLNYSDSATIIILLKQARNDFIKSSFLSDTYFGQSIPQKNSSKLKALLSAPAEKILRRALDTDNKKLKFELNWAAAEQFMAAGNFFEASKRFAFLCYRFPENIVYHQNLTKCLYKIAEENLKKPKEHGPILLCPLRNITKNPEHQWISRGFGYLLHSIKDFRTPIEIINPIEVYRIKNKLMIKDDKLYQPKHEAKTISNLVSSETEWIITGYYMTFGPMIKLSLNFYNKKTDQSSSIEVKGNLNKIHKLMKDLYQTIVFEITEKIPSKVSMIHIPSSLDDVKVWCKLIDLFANGDENKASSYISELIVSGNSEAILAKANILINEKEYDKAINLLKMNLIKSDCQWRYYHTLGEAAYLKGNQKLAKNYFYKSFKLNISN